MRILFLSALWLLLALGLGAATPKGFVASREAWGDPWSGPERTTLAAKPWGTVYYLVGIRNRYPLQPDMTGQYTFGLPQGDARTNPEGEGYAITFPDKTDLVVAVEGEEVRVTFKRRQYSVRRLLNGFVVRMPDDTVTYSKRGRDVTIKGRAGVVSVREDALGFEVTSPAGTSTYRRDSFEEPFKFSGIPMASHPYLRRGLHIESLGLGVFLDFHIQDLGRAFSALGWEPLLLVQ